MVKSTLIEWTLLDFPSSSSEEGRYPVFELVRRLTAFARFTLYSKLLVMVPNGVDDAMNHLKRGINQLRSRFSSCWDRRTTDEVTEGSRLLPDTGMASKVDPRFREYEEGKLRSPACRRQKNTTFHLIFTESGDHLLGHPRYRSSSRG